jgi:hypothetical protein
MADRRYADVVILAGMSTYANSTFDKMTSVFRDPCQPIRGLHFLRRPAGVPTIALTIW